MCVMSSQGLTMKWMTKNIALYKIYMVLRLNIYCISYMYIFFFNTISFLEKADLHRRVYNQNFQGKEMNAKIKVILIQSTIKYEPYPVICNVFFM